MKSSFSKGLWFVAFSVPIFLIGNSEVLNPARFMRALENVLGYAASLAVENTFGPLMIQGPGLVLFAVSFVMFLVGCRNIAISKGYSAWYGALGLLSFLGVLILLFLPNLTKRKTKSEDVSDSSTWPPSPV